MFKILDADYRQITPTMEEREKQLSHKAVEAAP